MGIVVGGYLESLRGKIASVLQGGGAGLGLQFGGQLFVLIFGGDDGHVLEILCCSADQGDAADVYFFDDICFRCSRGNCFFKRIQIHNHEVNGRDVVGGSLRDIALVVSTLEDASKNLGM